MPAEDAVEVQRALRGRLQASRRELGDPHAAGLGAIGDLRSVALGLQEYRSPMPLVAELGDTLGEVANLVEALCGQVASLKSLLEPESGVASTD